MSSADFVSQVLSLAEFEQTAAARNDGQVEIAYLCNGSAVRKAVGWKARLQG